MGSYQKSASNPIIEKNTDRGGVISGTWDNSLFQDREGKVRCVYHGRALKTGDQRIVFISDVFFDEKGQLNIFTD